MENASNDENERDEESTQVEENEDDDIESTAVDKEIEDAKEEAEEPEAKSLMVGNAEGEDESDEEGRISGATKEKIRQANEIRSENKSTKKKQTSGGAGNVMVAVGRERKANTIQTGSAYSWPENFRRNQ